MIRRLTLMAAFLAAVVALYAGVPVADESDSHKVRFAWGAEFGSSIDLSAHDMSSIDFNAGFGLSWRWLSLAAIGAGANIMVSNSCRTYPLFAVIRTSFSDRPRLVFLDVRGGVALNYLPRNMTQTGAYTSAGIGFNLAGNRKFQSYIVAGYTFINRRDVTDQTGTQPYEPLHFAGIRLGVSF